MSAERHARVTVIDNVTGARGDAAVALERVLD